MTSDAVAHDALVLSGCRLNSALQLSQGSESEEGKEGEKQLGQCLVVVPKGTQCCLGSLCCHGRDGTGELQRSRGKQCLADQGS